MLFVITILALIALMVMAWMSEQKIRGWKKQAKVWEDRSMQWWEAFQEAEEKLEHQTEVSATAQKMLHQLAVEKVPSLQDMLGQTATFGSATYRSQEESLTNKLKKLQIQVRNQEVKIRRYEVQDDWTG